MAEHAPSAGEVVRSLATAGLTVAVAESLTGGLLTSTLVDVAGASDVLRGAVVAYATDLKAELLGVDEALLARCGPVDPTVAAQMAQGVRERLGADLGVATTGVAGPDPQDGVRPGTAFVALVTAGAPASVRTLTIPGDRTAVRLGCVQAALAMLWEEAIRPRR